MPFKNGQTVYVSGMLGPIQATYISERKNLYVCFVPSLLGGGYYSEFKKSEVFRTKKDASKKSTF